MKVTNQLDEFIDTINEMLQRCHDALAPTAKQADRNKLREALATYLKAKPDDTVREA